MEVIFTILWLPIITQNLSGDEIGISLYRLIIGSNNI